MPASYLALTGGARPHRPNPAGGSVRSGWIAQPEHTAAFNGDGQQTSTITGGTAPTYTHAGADQNELLTQSTVTGGGPTYAYPYGRTDRNGLPVIRTETRTSGTSVATAYFAHDPSGLPVMIQTSTGTEALCVYDGRNNPVSLLTDFNSTAYVYNFDPYATATLTTTSGGSAVSENPYLYGGGLQDRATGHLKDGARWYDPTTGTWTQQDTGNTPLTQATPTATAMRLATLSTTPTPLGKALETSRQG